MHWWSPCRIQCECGHIIKITTDRDSLINKMRESHPTGLRNEYVAGKTATDWMGHEWNEIKYFVWVHVITQHTAWSVISRLQISQLKTLRLSIWVHFSVAHYRFRCCTINRTSIRPKDELNRTWTLKKQLSPSRYREVLDKCGWSFCCFLFSRGNRGCVQKDFNPPSIRIYT